VSARAVTSRFHVNFDCTAIAAMSTLEAIERPFGIRRCQRCAAE
jgi:hypothetical protein